MGWIRTDYSFDIPGIIMEVDYLLLKMVSLFGPLREALESDDPNRIALEIGLLMNTVDGGKYTGTILIGVAFSMQRGVWRFSLIHKAFPTVEQGHERDVYTLECNLDNELRLVSTGTYLQ